MKKVIVDMGPGGCVTGEVVGRLGMLVAVKLADGRRTWFNHADVKTMNGL